MGHSEPPSEGQRPWSLEPLWGRSLHVPTPKQEAPTSRTEARSADGVGRGSSPSSSVFSHRIGSNTIPELQRGFAAPAVRTPFRCVGETAQSGVQVPSMALLPVPLLVERHCIRLPWRSPDRRYLVQLLKVPSVSSRTVTTRSRRGASTGRERALTRYRDSRSRCRRTRHRGRSMPGSVKSR